MAVDKIFYNDASQVKLGWEPNWFGEVKDSEDLLLKVKRFQLGHGLTPDGLVGPMTFRRIFTEREANIDDYKPSSYCQKDNNYIVHNSKFTQIDWPKVVLWSDPGGLQCQPGTYALYNEGERKPKFFVNHWDVCLSSASCAKVIAKRGISIHFCIDNDGTIYQLLDTQHVAWQAGGKGLNIKSIGVEISNAYYTKYNSWYGKNNFGYRPVIEDATVHGKKLGKHLGFYDVQLEALKALWKAVHDATGIPLKRPTDSEGKTSNVLDRQASKGQFKGFVSHYHLTRRKIDCAGLDIKGLLDSM